MKRLYALLFAFGMLLSVGAYAQDVTVKIGDEEAFANTNVLIPVYMDATDAPGDGVCSFEFGMSFESDVLEFVGFHSETIDVSDIYDIDSGSGYLVFNWTNVSADITDDVVLFYIEFTYSGGSSIIEFDVDAGNIDAIEISRCDDASPHNAAFLDGSISERTAPIPVSQWAFFLGFRLMALFLVIRVIRIL